MKSIHPPVKPYDKVKKQKDIKKLLKWLNKMGMEYGQYRSSYQHLFFEDYNLKVYIN